jgi:hypothetical protein
MHFFTCISVSDENIFLKFYSFYLNLICWRRCTFGYNRPLIKYTLPNKHSSNLMGVGFYWRDFPNNSHLSLYGNLLKTLCGCLVIIIIKVCYWKSCVTGQLYLGCICGPVTAYSSAIIRTFDIKSKCDYNRPHIKCNLLQQKWIFWW